VSFHLPNTSLNSAKQELRSVVAYLRQTNTLIGSRQHLIINFWQIEKLLPEPADPQ
jgi:hypothetical protein